MQRYARSHLSDQSLLLSAATHAVAERRLHLTAVGLLAPHLSEGTVDELLSAATHQGKSEIEQLLAERFPKPDVLAWVVGPSPSSADRQHALAHVEDEHALAHVEVQPVPGPVDRS